MTQAFREAVDTGRAILKDKWQDSNVTANRQQGITEVRCPGCGNVIRKLLPVGHQEVSRVKNQTFIRESVQLVCLSNYREVSFEMSDGSRHVACLCEECAPLANDPMFAVAIYSANLSEFSNKGTVLSDATCDRAPVRLLETGLVVE